MTRQEKLLEGPIAPTLIRFALPLLFTNFLHSLSGTWNAIWVSHVLGDYALTAVVNSNIFMYMMMGAVMGIGLAAGVAIGQSIGSGDAQAVRRVVGTSITAVIGSELGSVSFARIPGAATANGVSSSVK